MPTLNEREINDAFGEYIPFAVTLAKRYQRKLPPGIDEKQDLIQEALIGLFRCLGRYDPTCGSLLKSWVSQHIKSAILDYLRTLDWFPQAVRAEIKQLKAAEEALRKELQREPTKQELADKLIQAESERMKAAGEALRKELQREPTKQELADKESELMKAAKKALPKQLRREPTNQELADKLIQRADELKQWLEIWSLISLDDPEFSLQSTPTVHANPESYTAMDQWWDRLTEQEKVAVRMWDEEATARDIAAVLGVAPATVYRILERAENKLRKLQCNDEDDEAPEE